jgi:hypothetical protein
MTGALVDRGLVCGKTRGLRKVIAPPDIDTRTSLTSVSGAAPTDATLSTRVPIIAMTGDSLNFMYSSP